MGLLSGTVPTPQPRKRFDATLVVSFLHHSGFVSTWWELLLLAHLEIVLSFNFALIAARVFEDQLWLLWLIHE